MTHFPLTGASGTDRKDFYTRVTERIVSDLEQGVRPWMKPWNAEHAAARIRRPSRHNGTPYNGMNVLLLWSELQPPTALIASEWISRSAAPFRGKAPNGYAFRCSTAIGSPKPAHTMSLPMAVFLPFNAANRNRLGFVFAACLANDIESVGLQIGSVGFQMASAKAPFRRRQVAWTLRCLMGILTDFVLGPAVWALGKAGKGDLVFRAINRSGKRRLTRSFGRYVPNTHDIVIAVYAKSGTNWVMQIVQQLLHHGRAEFDHIHSVVAWPETMNDPALRHYAIPLEDETPWRSSPEGKRAIKTHLNWEHIPYSKEARYISVIRDPKDVFVSNYFFLRNMLPLPSVEAWFRFFCSDDFYLYGSWAVNTAGYWAQRKRPNVLVLSFKAMKQDLEGTVRRIAEFLQIRLGSDELKLVCEKASFDYMRSVDEKFEVWNVIPWHSRTRMMRKGTQGGSSELLSTDQQRQMDEYFMGELKRLGSDFPYAEFCDATAPPA